jgi:hypothetical protein
MDEKSLIFGPSDSIEDLIMELIKKKIDLDLENDYYLNITPPPIHISPEYFDDSVISGIFVDLNEKLLNAIHRWLESRKNQKNLKLNLIIDGNLLNINVHDVKILLKILNECSEQKK